MPLGSEKDGVLRLKLELKKFTKIHLDFIV